MKGKVLLAILLMTATLATLPTVDAHQCGGDDCGPCTEGEFHQHGDPDGSGCQSSAGLPGFEVALVAAGVAAAALIVGRRRD